MKDWTGARLYDSEMANKKPTCVGFFIGLNQLISLQVQQQEPLQPPEQLQEQKQLQQPTQVPEQVLVQQRVLVQERVLQQAFRRKRSGKEQAGLQLERSVSF
jgi:hypothetical protein